MSILGVDRKGKKVSVDSILDEKGNTKMVRVLFQVVLPIKIKKKPGVYVSSCNVLDVHSQGYTEAQDNEEERQSVNDPAFLSLT